MCLTCGARARSVVSAEVDRTQHRRMAVVGLLSVVASGKITVCEAESISGAGRQIPQDDKWGTWISEVRTERRALARLLAADKIRNAQPKGDSVSHVRWDSWGGALMSGPS